MLEAPSGEEGIDQAIKYHPDIVLLDMRLPDTDGLAVLKRLRDWSKAPVLVLSVRNHEDDKIKALDHGADDYITKPFSTGELLARLRVVRRHAEESAQIEIFRTGTMTVDVTTRTVTIKGKPVRLTATEYSLLLLFVKHAGKVLTHRQILQEIWNSNDAEKTGPLRVYMAYLRDKLETDSAKPELFLTEPGVGYRLCLKD